MMKEDPALGISQALADMIEEFRVDSGASPVEINTGMCADFADAFTSFYGRGTEVLGTDDLFEEARSGGERMAGAVPPPGTTWELLDALGAVDVLSHSWIAHDGLHYDAEAIEGVANPFDLPCIRHCLHELIEMREEDLLAALTDEHPWWQDTSKIRLEREPLLFGAQNAPSP
jgi:hypothetical protein